MNASDKVFQCLRQTRKGMTVIELEQATGLANGTIVSATRKLYEAGRLTRERVVPPDGGFYYTYTIAMQAAPKIHTIRNRWRLLERFDFIR